MRSRVIGAALSLVAVPAFAQVPKAVTGPWSLTPNMVLCTDLPVPTHPLPRLVVKGVYDIDPRLATAKGGQLIIARHPDDGLAPGQRYITARVPREIVRSEDDRLAFGSVRVTGIVTVKATDETNALVDINLACDSIEVGDFLEPYADLTLPAGASPVEVPPDFSDRAKILFGSDSRSLVGHGSITSIDRGTLHGVVPGARFAIYRDAQRGMPLVHIGEAVVLSTGELSSKVMITKALDGIETHDIAVPRRQP